MKKLLFAAAVAVVSQHVYAQNDSVARQIDEVVVTGTRFQTDIRHLPMTVSVVNRQKLVENQRTNILPTLSEQVPGLFVSSRGMMGYGLNNGAGAISLRGIAAGSGQLLVLIDGHPQYQGIYGHPIGDAYQTMMAERVEVLRGPASVLYGSNAMGGVVNIVTQGMHTDGVRTNLHVGAGSYGTFQSELSNQVRSGRFSSTVAANYSRSDNHRPNSAFEQYGGHLKLGYDLSQNWNAYLDADVTHFNASVPGTVQSPMLEWNQWATRGAVTAAIENHYGRTSGALSIYNNFGRHKINDGYAANGGNPRDRYFRSRDALAGVSLYQSFNLFEGNRLTLGFDYQHIYGRAFYTSRATGEVIDTPNKQSGHSHRNEIAGYADFRQDITPWLTIDAGLRVDYHNITGTEWVPQGGIVVRPTDDGELKLRYNADYSLLADSASLSEKSANIGDTGCIYVELTANNVAKFITNAPVTVSTASGEYTYKFDKEQLVKSENEALSLSPSGRRNLIIYYRVSKGLGLTTDYYALLYKEVE